MPESNWYKSNRKAEMPPDWEQRRKVVGDRDGWRCQWPRTRGICGAPANQCDHRLAPDDHRYEALWMLCRWHHTAKTQQESAAARRLLAEKGRHPVEKHPGLL